MAAPGMPNHQSVVDNSKIHWLRRSHPESVGAMSRRLAIANDLGQKDILGYLHELIRGHNGLPGKNQTVDMVFQIAKNEEAVQVASELTAPRRGV